MNLWVLEELLGVLFVKNKHKTENSHPYVKNKGEKMSQMSHILSFPQKCIVKRCLKLSMSYSSLIFFYY